MIPPQLLTTSPRRKLATVDHHGAPQPFASLLSEQREARVQQWVSQHVCSIVRIHICFNRPCGRYTHCHTPTSHAPVLSTDNSTVKGENCTVRAPPPGSHTCNTLFCGWRQRAIADQLARNLSNNHERCQLTSTGLRRQRDQVATPARLDAPGRSGSSGTPAVNRLTLSKRLT